MEMKEEQFQDKPLRLFVAVRIPESIQLLLEAWRLRNEDQLAFKKWTHLEDYHITVQFLGDAEAGRVPEITDALKRASLKINPFDLEFGSFGTFGTAEAPRVLWAGVIDQSGGLDKIYEAVTSEMGELGFAKEARPYRPHVTIARKYAGKSPFPGQNLPLLTEKNSGSGGTAEPLIWEVNEFVLFSTHLHEKPMYEILEAVQMKDS
ncbi:RNA 2',3'-cyclic phosphodiesterase [Paenibacillus sp. XY044]|uniref:RNA 2',3'-cyclic phosphodiesterase n=1 Tax=Paenibacillus sp. XY044 TaxID=2026089 RepID=UPI0015C60765|nr:RNA 2',3'-cyclic phosphodiesterase [Paenibacillus sp. XY044]